MIAFQQIEDRAALRHGGHDVLETFLTRPVTPDVIAAIPANRWLSEMSRMVFQAGFNWQLIDKKWPVFEEAFNDFNLPVCAHLSEEALEQKMASGTLVKSWQKMKTIPHNAAMLLEIEQEHGTVGHYFSSWKTTDFNNNIHAVSARGSRLGGSSLSVILRRMGVDALVPSGDVIGALHDANIIDGPLKSKKSWKQLQHALDQWQAETGRSITEISQILGLSYGEVYHDKRD